MTNHAASMIIPSGRMAVLMLAVFTVSMGYGVWLYV
jgi:hypothetical protein